MENETGKQVLAKKVYLAQREMKSAFYNHDQAAFSRASAEYDRLTRGYSKRQIYSLLDLATRE